jgi:hypothetical protein
MKEISVHNTKSLNKIVKNRLKVQNNVCGECRDFRFECNRSFGGREEVEVERSTVGHLEQQVRSRVNVEFILKLRIIEIIVFLYNVVQCS